MPSKRTSRRNQMGDSNASTDSSIGDKSKKFRCVMQRIVDKDQSLASPFNVAHDSLRKRVDKMAVWTANKETTIDDYSTANRMEDHSISLNSRAHLAGCAEDRVDRDRVVNSSDRLRMNSTYPLMEGFSSSRGSSMKIDDSISQGTVTDIIGQTSFLRDDPIEAYYQKRSIKETTENLVKYLGSSNMKLEEIPFYDIRMGGLEGRKTRAAQYNEECRDPELIARHFQIFKHKTEAFQILKNIEMKKIAIKKQEKLDRWDGGNFNHPLERTKKMKGISAECPSVNSMEYSMGNSLESEREVTVNTILVKGDNDMNERILNDNISLSSCPSSPALLTERNNVIQKNCDMNKKTRKLFLKNIETHFDNDNYEEENKKNSYYHGADTPTSTMSTISTPTLSPIRNELQEKIKEKSNNYLGKTHFINTNQSNKIDFYPIFVATSKTKNNLLDHLSLTSLIEPKITKPKIFLSGKKMGPKSPTDFTRVGYGSDCTFYDKRTIKNRMDNTDFDNDDENENENENNDDNDDNVEYSRGNGRDKGRGRGRDKESRNSFNGNFSFSDLSVLSRNPRSSIQDYDYDRNNNNCNYNNETNSNSNSNMNSNINEISNLNSNVRTNFIRNSTNNLTSPNNSVDTSISRPYEGCDDKRRKDEKRKARYERTYVTLEGINKRLDESTLDKRLKELSYNKSRNEDNIRFDTNVFINDVKSFRGQPVQEMSRKCFPSMSQRMWGGQNKRSLIDGHGRMVGCKYS